MIRWKRWERERQAEIRRRRAQEPKEPLYLHHYLKNGTLVFVAFWEPLPSGIRAARKTDRRWFRKMKLFLR